MQLSREHFAIVIAVAAVAGYIAGRAGAKGPVEAEPFELEGEPAMAAADSGPAVTPAPADQTPAEPAAVMQPAAAPAPKPAAAPPKPAATAPQAARPAPKPAPRPTPSHPTATASAPEISDKVWKVELHDDDASIGPEDAPATVVLFTTFGCQPCMEFQPAIDRLRKEYGDKVRVVFKHKVFDAPSPDALVAAECSLAAKDQGKFWEMAGKLFEARFDVGRSTCEKAAGELGLDVAKVRRALDRGAHREQVLRDSLLVYEVGAHSFPNVLVNGLRMPKPKNYTSLKATVDAALRKAEAERAKGTPAKDLYARLIAGGNSFEQLGPPAGAIDDSGPSMGAKDAKVTMIAFEDFECPYCAQSFRNLRAFAERFPKRVRFVFKHYPLSGLHPHAQLAHEAAEEARAQGKFWEFHDVLFANQKALSRADLERYAEQVGLDMAKFEAALDSGKHKDTIRQHQAAGQRARVTGTPTVFLNGRKYQGPRGYNPLGLEAVSRTMLGL